MRLKAPLYLATAVLAALALDFPADSQVTAPPADFPIRTFFSVRSARPDASIPEIFREQFEKDDGSPLKSVPVDLDGDGKDEKFVLCAVPSSSGGYQWLVYDTARGVGRGVVIGALIFIGRETAGGYSHLETYWKQGGDMSVVFRYKYARGKYGRADTRALTLWETSEYFKAKPPLDFDRELVEIK